MNIYFTNKDDNANRSEVLKSGGKRILTLVECQNLNSKQKRYLYLLQTYLRNVEGQTYQFKDLIIELLRL